MSHLGINKPKLNALYHHTDFNSATRRVPSAEEFQINRKPLRKAARIHGIHWIDSPKPFQPTYGKWEEIAYR